MDGTRTASHRGAWNKGKLVGQKAPFKLQGIWAIHIRLQMQGRVRELSLFDLGLDSKLRACDMVKLRVGDVCHSDRVFARAIMLQQKIQRPVQFGIRHRPARRWTPRPLTLAVIFHLDPVRDTAQAFLPLTQSPTIQAPASPCGEVNLIGRRVIL